MWLLNGSVIAESVSGWKHPEGRLLLCAMTPCVRHRAGRVGRTVLELAA